MSHRTSHIILASLVVVFGVVALAAMIAVNSTAREVATGTAQTLFGIFTTPVIFESTIAIFGIFIVLAISRWRVHKEGDGWVYLVTQEPDQDDAKLPASISQRMKGVVMQDKPEAMDEAGTARAKVEGFLELGMAAQAAEALEENRDLPDDEATAALRVRVLAANLDTAPAQGLLRASNLRFSAHHELFARTALDCANWLEAHAPHQKAAVRLWHAEVSEVTTR
jgi:hypothetical protein